MIGKIEILKWSSASAARKNEIMLRSQSVFEDIYGQVGYWLNEVKSNGNKGILEYIKKFDLTPDGMIGRFKADKFTVKNFRVSDKETNEAFKSVDPDLLEKIKRQILLSRNYHQSYINNLKLEFTVEQAPGVIAGYRKLPVDSAGLYVPAGKAPLPTVAQILTVAAKSAAVKRVVVCFPPTTKFAEDAIIVAAKEAGADEIYRIGGIAAIAAMTYGTETVSSVQKIAGPGNPWVQVAKLQVVSKVGIDMFSGPSEAVILADQTADPKFLAADILARCEHGPDSAGVLVTTSGMIAERTKTEIENQKVKLARLNFINESLSRFSAIIVVDSEEEMIKFCNDYKPEHLHIQTKIPNDIFRKVRHAGSVFIGQWAPVAAGDYASGTNHCLPTGVATAFSSPVSPETFLKTVQYQELTQDGLKLLKPIVEKISDIEGLDAHKRSVQIRFE